MWIKNLFLFFIICFGFTKVPFSQDSLRLSVEGEFKVVPLLSSFYHDFRFYNMSSEQGDTSIILTNKPTNFRPSLNFRINLHLQSEKFIVGVGAKYAPVKNYWNKIRHPDSTKSMLLTENIKTDYIGIHTRILFNPKKENRIIGGLTLGSGLLTGRTNQIKATDPTDELSTSGTSKKIMYSITEMETFDLGYKIRLWDLYLNYTFQYVFEFKNKLDLYFGFEVPLMRLFFYNSEVRTGFELNNETTFTSFQSFTPIIGDQSSGNKNLAYSLKKTHASSLNFGIRYKF